MRRSVTRTWVGLLVLIALLAPTAVTAADGVSADLDGAPIKATEAGEHFCHDLDYPILHCFSTAKELDAAFLGARASADGVTATSYIVIYEDEAYRGAYAYLSQDYGNLGSIGWNDRITGFKVVNSGSGHFAEHIADGGLHYSFCCNQQLSNIGQTWNDRISSVYQS